MILKIWESSAGISNESHEGWLSKCPPIMKTAVRRSSVCWMMLFSILRSTEGMSRRAKNGKKADSSEEVCLTVNTTGCLSDWEIFKAAVVNNSWIGIYGVRGNSPYLPNKLEIRWELQPSVNTIRRISKTWNSVGGVCVYSDDILSGGLNGRSQMEVTTGNTVLIERVYSSNPGEFFIYSVCVSERCSGICQNPFTVLLIKDQRVNNTGPVILNGIPWCEIEDNLQQCFNLTFVEPPGVAVEWAWQGNDC